MAKPSINSEIRKWALVMAVILAGIGTLQYMVRHHQLAGAIFWILAAVFFLPGLLAPAALRPVFRLWMKFAEALGWVSQRVILSLTFYLVFTPLGLIMRLLGKDLISEKWDRQAKSYWIEREAVPLDRDRYEKQY